LIGEGFAGVAEFGVADRAAVHDDVPAPDTVDFLEWAKSLLSQCAGAEGLSGAE